MLFGKLWPHAKYMSGEWVETSTVPYDGPTITHTKQRRYCKVLVLPGTCWNNTMFHDCERHNKE